MNIDHSNRIATYDFLKGIGILLVVLGHITHNDMLWRSIFAFHMPLFFFLSGILYKDKEQFVYKQLKALMFPYFVFSILSFLYWYFIELRFRELKDGTNVLDQLINIIFPMNIEGSYEFNAVLWFLPCLFVTSLSYHFYQRLDIKKYSDLILLLLSLLCASFIKIKLPFFISEMFCSLPFYICGAILNKNKNQLSLLTEKKIPCMITGLVLLPVVFFIVITFFVRTNMKTGFYSHGYAVAFICALALVFGLYLLVRELKKQRVLQWLGMNSLCIMLIHEPIKRIIIKVYSVLLSQDVDYIRESIWHSMVLLLIIVTIVSLITIVINKYANFLLGKF